MSIHILNQTDGLHRRTEALSWLLCVRKTLRILRVDRKKPTTEDTFRDGSLIVWRSMCLYAYAYAYVIHHAVLLAKRLQSNHIDLLVRNVTSAF